MDAVVHFVSAVHGDVGAHETFVADAMKAARDGAGSEIVNEIPPPSRAILLAMAPSGMGSFLEFGMERVFAVVFEKEICVCGQNMDASFLANLKGIIGRVTRQNNDISAYGFTVVVYVPGLSNDHLASLYHQLRMYLGDDNRTSIATAQSVGELGYVIRHLHLQFAHGEKTVRWKGL